MMPLEEQLLQIFAANIDKMIISKPRKKDGEYKKIVVERKEKYFQIAKYTAKQVFHENITPEQIASVCYELTNGFFGQVNAWTSDTEYYILISKKGIPSLKSKKIKIVSADACDSVASSSNTSHNRKKNYILEEGTPIPPLVDMGIFTKEGMVVKSMYDKFKQINRFIEMIDDSIREQNLTSINVIDFGCGKTYLTFILYYYFTEIKKIQANIIGLDLKKDVIQNCNTVAKKYYYTNLRFELGDINGYKAPFDVDMVITLHACDTATDYALYNAISWNARMIFSVPCCQHELNAQITPTNLSILSDYGIIKERFSALATDAIRGKLLEACGYKTQLLEFIDFAHTPKNILIRATKKAVRPRNVTEKALEKVDALCDEFNFKPTLYELLRKDNII